MSDACNVHIDRWQWQWIIALLLSCTKIYCITNVSFNTVTLILYCDCIILCLYISVVRYTRAVARIFVGVMAFPSIPSYAYLTLHYIILDIRKRPTVHDIVNRESVTIKSRKSKVIPVSSSLLPSPPSIIRRKAVALIQVGGFRECCKLPQWLRAEPGRYTIFGAFRA